MPQPPHPLFSVFGVELEYMLVDRDSLDVRPLADKVLTSLAGQLTSDVECGPVTWSNELARHVIEIKTTAPANDLRLLPQRFRTAIADLQSTLDPLHLCLLPTAAHPWMQPAREAELWPHECSEIYQAYDRIFDCRTHSWSNVQSVHLNLPFAGDEEFARLHAATRLVLPLLPALAASSPIIDGAASGFLDTRMHLYAGHCQAVPSLIGDVIPEAIFDQQTYQREILDTIARDIRPHDPDHVLQVEFCNARGAIARFDRGSIELRVMDVQEYPGADIAICAAAAAVTRALCMGRWTDLETQQSVSTPALRRLLDKTTQHAEHAIIDDAKLLGQFGIRQTPMTASQLWSTLLPKLRHDNAVLDGLYPTLQVILREGTLATRIQRATGKNFSREQLAAVYRQLSECLTEWKPFQP
ncbi:glutamate-cysteine ligase family protein [Roseimaritima ulvae]|uniref:Carboxylate-amine ligase YbdK n=1 Tax=Roseimaritima ulvae TaxID=980254 RepID=A0A5B9QWI2_9BACT|nr:glutamate-cysteine ligase family protein [Roseimaritima ulvae]QEG38313.1 Carboxylate-amine ligase YbdK [Roseimaritima ulvae]